MNTATLINGPVSTYSGGTRCLWKTNTGNYIITSSIDDKCEPPISETEAFPATAEGNITVFTSLAHADANQHEQCIKNAGYEITP